MKGWSAVLRCGRTGGLLPLSVALLVTLSPPASAWGNGGRSADPAHPDYGAHDWIAEKAARLLPESRSSYMLGNLAAYLYGTEVPDFVIEDQQRHHVYFHPDGTLMEDDSAARARETYALLVEALRARDLPLAAQRAGILTHYIADLAVFGHVLSSKTVWGAEKHHGDFEDDADLVMKGPGDSFFSVIFDGALDARAPFDAAVDLARATTFGDGNRTARWLDDHYSPGPHTWDPAFRDQVGSLVSLAVNLIADVLASSAVEAQFSSPVVRDPSTWPKLTEAQLLIVGILVALLLAGFASLMLRQRGRR